MLIEFGSLTQTQTQTQTVWEFGLSNPNPNQTQTYLTKSKPNPNPLNQTQTPKLFGFEFGIGACLVKMTALSREKSFFFSNCAVIENGLSTLSVFYQSPKTAYKILKRYKRRKKRSHMGAMHEGGAWPAAPRSLMIVALPCSPMVT